MVEIDRLGDAAIGSVDTFRWSIDGGLSFVQEYVPITAGISQSLIYGLDANFTNATGHGLGDRWTFTGRPLNQIVSIASGGSNSINVSRTRDDLHRAIEYSRSQGLLAVRTYLDSNTSLLYLAHTFSQATFQDVAISGSALSSNGGNIILIDNDANGDGQDDNYVLSQAKDGKLNQPFGLTWEANQSGEFIIFAIAEDTKGNRVTSSSTIISVIDAVGEVPVVSLGAVESPLSIQGEPVPQSFTAEATDPDGQIASVSFYSNGQLVGEDTSSPYSVDFELNATGHFECMQLHAIIWATLPLPMSAGLWWMKRVKLASQRL